MDMLKLQLEVWLRKDIFHTASERNFLKYITIGERILHTDFCCRIMQIQLNKIIWNFGARAF